MRVLISGASGFIGANLARRALADGHEVIALVRQSYEPWRLGAIRDDLRIHVADLRDRAGLFALLERVRPDWVFHTAAYGAYPGQQDVPTMLSTNVECTANLVDAAVGIGFAAFVNSGSSSEYGFKDGPARESDLLEPNSFYAVTKASSTLYCDYSARRSGLRIRTLRLYSAYGPFEEPSRLIPTLVRAATAGRWPPLVRPSIARDFVYVDDVCEAYTRAASEDGVEPGGIYNVGSGIQTTLGAAVDAARHVFGVSSEPVWGGFEPRAWDQDVWVADPSKIRRELGWQARTDFKSGLRRTAEWIREHDARLAAAPGARPGAGG